MDVSSDKFLEDFRRGVERLDAQRRCAVVAVKLTYAFLFVAVGVVLSYAIF